ncbi:TetR/AcrR family transcriptional regulator [Nocardioides anomalus]|uniref:TetR/AcrR family transcriptional regulator n=1 Tax=Nocardioides anomalus TaxID=2712223 RepID=A0A6G6W924_9ACTN|nr:TetR/AcrR family transcriptional regulator [Nocardioides anomalus]QIG41851.1 TetR/AcrR family transcriptional regulator [Nocardioides anomalus]
MTEPTAPPRRGRPGHDRGAVLAAAVALFIRKGYDATSIDDIARSLGVTKSAVYHHVSSKEQLLADALDEALDELDATVDAATEADGPAVERLRTAVERSVEVLVAHQSAVTLLLRVHGNSDTEVAALRRRRRIDRALAGLVREAVDEGALRADLDPDVVSRLLFGMVNSLVEWYRAGGPVTSEELARSVAGLAFDGLRG